MVIFQPNRRGASLYFRRFHYCLELVACRAVRERRPGRCFRQSDGQPADADCGVASVVDVGVSASHHDGAVAAVDRDVRQRSQSAGHASPERVGVAQRRRDGHTCHAPRRQPAAGGRLAAPRGGVGAGPAARPALRRVPPPPRRVAGKRGDAEHAADRVQLAAAQIRRGGEHDRRAAAGGEGQPVLGLAGAEPGGGGQPGAGAARADVQHRTYEQRLAHQPGHPVHRRRHHRRRCHGLRRHRRRRHRQRLRSVASHRAYNNINGCFYDIF